MAEAQFPKVFPHDIAPEAIEQIQKIVKSTIEMEQYLDFLRNRSFRHTLLVHEGVLEDHGLHPARVTNFYANTRARAVEVETESGDEKTPNTETFVSADGAKFTTNHPIMKAAMIYLWEVTPRAIHFDELFRIACERAGIEQPTERDKLTLASNLLKAYTYSFQQIDFHTYPIHMVQDVSEKPVASPLARFQMENGMMLCNLYHERIELEPMGRILLPHLDGQHNKEELYNILLKLVEDGQISLKSGGEPVEDHDKIQRKLREEVDRTLRWIARAGLLVG
jgi:methyltransferase-like protein